MTFCRMCGAVVGESQRFCGSCGASLTTLESQPAPKRARLGRLIVWSLGACLGFLVLRGLVSEPNTERPTSNSEESSPKNTPDTTTVSSQTQVKEDEPPGYKFGQSFSIGYWSYLCHSAFWTSVLGSSPYSLERANAKFVVVDITVRNDDTSSSTLPPLQLRDAQGRTYDESSAVMLGQGFFSVLEQLNPGVSKRGHIAFDVPPDRQYSLILSGGIESGKRASVILPMSVPADEQSPPGGSQ
jgi:hypothetical protein